MSFVQTLQISAFKGVRSVRRAFFPLFDPMGEALIQTRSGAVHHHHHMIKVRVARKPLPAASSLVTPPTPTKELELVPLEAGTEAELGVAKAGA